MDVEQSRLGWYTIVQGAEIHQGDFLSRFPILVPPYSASELTKLEVGERLQGEFDIKFFNVIVLTQSCDLVDCEDDTPIILCPRYDYRELSRVDPKTYGANGWGNLVRGRMIGKYLLDKCDLQGFEFEYQLVDLRQVFNVPYRLVKTIAEQKSARIRLQSPYREQLAQAFGLQFMRIGLLEDLPRKYPY